MFRIGTAPRQLFGVASIGLDPVDRIGGHQRGRDHIAFHPERGELPREHVSGWSGFIVHANVLRRAELLYQFPNRFQPVRDDSQVADLTAGFGNRRRDGVRVDIETEKVGVRQILAHAGTEPIAVTAAFAVHDRWWHPRYNRHMASQKATRVPGGWSGTLPLLFARLDSTPKAEFEKVGVRVRRESGD